MSGGIVYGETVKDTVAADGTVHPAGSVVRYPASSGIDRMNQEALTPRLNAFNSDNATRAASRVAEQAAAAKARVAADPTLTGQAKVDAISHRAAYLPRPLAFKPSTATSTGSPFAPRVAGRADQEAARQIARSAPAKASPFDRSAKFTTDPVKEGARVEQRAQDRSTLATDRTIAVDPKYAGFGQLTTTQKNGAFVRKASPVPGVNAFQTAKIASPIPSAPVSNPGGVTGAPVVLGDPKQSNAVLLANRTAARARETAATPAPIPAPPPPSASPTAFGVSMAQNKGPTLDAKPNAFGGSLAENKPPTLEARPSAFAFEPPRAPAPVVAPAVNPGDSQARAMFGGLNEPFLPKVGAFVQRVAAGGTSASGSAASTAVDKIGAGLTAAGTAVKNVLTGQTEWQKGGLIAGTEKQRPPDQPAPTASAPAPVNVTSEEEKLKRKNAFSGAPSLTLA